MGGSQVDLAVDAFAGEAGASGQNCAEPPRGFEVGVCVSPQTHKNLMESMSIKFLILQWESGGRLVAPELIRGCGIENRESAFSVCQLCWCAF